MNFEKWDEKMFLKHGAFEKRYAKTNNMLLKHLGNQRMDVIIRMLNCINTDAVLDVGCGDGTLIKKIDAGEIVGIDASRTAVAIAKRKLKNKKNAIIKLENAEKMRFPKNRFDKIACTEVLEHTSNPRKVINEIRRVVKRNGLAVISVPNEKNVERIKTLLKRIRLFDMFFGRLSGSCSEEWHIHNFDKKMFKKLVSGKFKIIETKSLPNFLIPITLVFKCKPIK